MELEETGGKVETLKGTTHLAETVTSVVLVVKVEKVVMAEPLTTKEPHKLLPIQISQITKLETVETVELEVMVEPQPQVVPEELEARVETLETVETVEPYSMSVEVLLWKATTS